jgi:LmbE family N-acetylglucosaminyl deacetylase
MNSNNLKVLAIGAHPDDIELGCSGTLKKHVLNGDEVYCIVASMGEKGGDRLKRTSEARRVADMLGVKEINFLNFPDTMIEHNGPTVELLDSFITENIDIIYVNSPKDYHQDHINISKSTLSAARNKKNSIFFYETPSTTIEFKPTAYIEITDVIKDKLEYLGQYESQKNKVYTEKQAILGLSKYRGYSIGVEYAEAFEVEKLFKWF